MTVGESHRNDRVARFYQLPDGRWHGEVTGAGAMPCGVTDPSYEAVIAFLTRRMKAPSGVGACPDGCEARP